MFVKKMTSFEKIILMVGIIKSLSSQEILVYFQKKIKPLKSKDTNGKTYGTK
jgi:hypothetical protein